MLRRAEVADIIDAARKDPRYLVNHYWLCALIDLRLIEADRDTADLYSLQVKKHIENSIGVYSFLKSYLRNKKIIPQHVQYDDMAYAVAAHDHWDKLIAKLRKKV